MRLQVLRERSVALCVAGALLLTPPLLLVADHSRAIFGIPVFYAYIFVCWAALIAGNAFLASRLVKASDDAADQTQD